MSFGAGGCDSFTVKKFETQEEVEEKKRQRQEQWAKVRKPDDPEECPEEETRSLFEQLQDNKESQQRDYEDEFKLRNSVKTLDEEETKFLDYVSNRQVQIEKEREKEEKDVLEEMKEAAVRRVQEKVSSTVVEPKKPAPSVVSSSKKSQQSLLMGAIKRKSTDSTHDDSAKRKRSESENSAVSSTVSSEEKGDALLELIDTSKPVAQVAGFLPGIGVYDNNSSSNSSSPESDIEDYMPKRTYAVQHVLDSIF